MKRVFSVGITLLAVLLLTFAIRWVPSTARSDAADPAFTFAVAADMRSFTGEGQYDYNQYFRGALQALINAGNVAFLISPGDIDPPGQARWTIDQVLGGGYRWVPVVGNHELPGAGQESGLGSNLAWLRAYHQGAVNPGPGGCQTTTFSFDQQSVHFVVLNEHCDTGGDAATVGDIPDALYDWLASDLSSHPAAHTFVIGHMPAYPQPDQDNGRLRHESDSLNQFPAHRDRFWNLLAQRGVTAYLCGHTHNYSAVKINGVWQIDAGHARGLGDTGAPSTLVLIRVQGARVDFQTYRDDAQGGSYALRHSDTLVGWQAFLPAVQKLSISGSY